MQQLQTLVRQYIREKAHAGDIAAGLVEAWDETERDRIGADRENDWNR